MPGQPVEYHPKPPHRLRTSSKALTAPKRGGGRLTRLKRKGRSGAYGAGQDVQGEVGELSKAVLSKDLDRELKQIQKLAKRLRREIAP